MGSGVWVMRNCSVGGVAADAGLGWKNPGLSRVRQGSVRCIFDGFSEALEALGWPSLGFVRPSITPHCQFADADGGQDQPGPTGLLRDPSLSLAIFATGHSHPRH